MTDLRLSDGAFAGARRQDSRAGRAPQPRWGVFATAHAQGMADQARHGLADGKIDTPSVEPVAIWEHETRVGFRESGETAQIAAVSAQPTTSIQEGQKQG